MSGITDVERGARIASEMAAARIMQPDLFGDAIPLELWEAVYDAAEDQIIECMALRSVCRRRVPTGDCDGERAMNATPERASVQ